AVMGLMVYLILVTKTKTPQLWNPYDILGLADVGNLVVQHCPGARSDSATLVCHRKGNQVEIPKTFTQISPRQNQARYVQERDYGDSQRAIRRDHEGIPGPHR